MSEKFTKRQWSVGCEFVGDDCVLAVMNSDGDEVCNFGNSLLNEPVNANLIAAAPELLEALLATLEWIDAVPDEVAATLPTMPGVSRDWIDEVVAKARGES